MKVLTIEKEWVLTVRHDNIRLRISAGYISTRLARQSTHEVLVKSSM